jgi:Methyltransferase domain
MTETARVRSFPSISPDFRRAFGTFLAHTDQKDKALAWIQREVSRLAVRGTMIDAGAGNGKLTEWFTGSFSRVVAIEPNASLETDLRANCPTAHVIPRTIMDASVSEAADFILCSHVLYFVDQSEWQSTLWRLAGWLAPGGVLAIGLQNPESDCMTMVDHFIGGRFNLRDLLQAEQMSGGRFKTELETFPAHIRAADLKTACEIAEFMLNVLPMPSPPGWSDLESYVDEHFRRSDGRYELSCHQDFLRVTRLG